MVKVKVFVVKNGRGRWMTNPRPEDLIGCPHVVNPDMSKLLGIHPEALRIEGGRLVSDLPPRIPPQDYRDETQLRGEIAQTERELRAKISRLTIALCVLTLAEILRAIL